ncbi:MAG: ECF-type sigma factor [Blastocatellia bacterium]
MERHSPGYVTQLLLEWSNGDREAFNKLVPLVYSELRRIAKQKFRELGRGGLLQPTALIHEAYIRLIDQTQVPWKNRAHFYGVAASTIRNILIDDYRKRDADKRGGKQGLAVSISEADNGSQIHQIDFIALNQALENLETLDKRQVKIIELRFLVGLNNDEIAQALDISRSTVEREWRSAKAWLHSRLTGAGL